MGHLPCISLSTSRRQEPLILLFLLKFTFISKLYAFVNLSVLILAATEYEQ